MKKILSLIEDILLFSAFFLISFGFYLIYSPLGFIVGGLSLIAILFLIAKGGKDDKKR